MHNLPWACQFKTQIFRCAHLDHEFRTTQTGCSFESWIHADFQCTNKSRVSCKRWMSRNTFQRSKANSNFRKLSEAGRNGFQANLAKQDSLQAKGGEERNLLLRKLSRQKATFAQALLFEKNPWKFAIATGKEGMIVIQADGMVSFQKCELLIRNVSLSVSTCATCLPRHVLSTSAKLSKLRLTINTSFS